MRHIGGWLVAQAGSFGLMFLHLLLTLILASILYMNGEDAAKIMLRFFHRIAVERGEHPLLALQHLQRDGDLDDVERFSFLEGPATFDPFNELFDTLQAITIIVVDVFVNDLPLS